MTIKEILFHLNRILPLIGLHGWMAEADRILPGGITGCAINEVDDIHHRIYTHWNLRHSDMTHSQKDSLTNIYHEAVHAYVASLKDVAYNIVDAYVDVELKGAVKDRIEDHVELLVGDLAVAFYNLIEKESFTK